MKAIIIDDEKKNINQLRSLVSKYCKELEVVDSALNAEKGIELIALHKPELVFLDIQMPDKSGFEMLAELGEYDFEVIFVTGFDQYGIQAVKFSALDYLLKPVKPVDLAKAVLKAENRKRKRKTNEQILNMLSTISNGRKADHRIALPLMKEIMFINPEEIIRCESVNNYTQFHFVNSRQAIVSKGIHEFDPLLKEYGFIRCHQSHLVNRKFIQSLVKKDIISELILTTGAKVPVSKVKRDLVKDELMRK